MKAMILVKKNDPGKCALFVWTLVGSDFMVLCSFSREEKHGTSVIFLLVKRGFSPVASVGAALFAATLPGGRKSLVQMCGEQSWNSTTAVSFCQSH